MMNIPAACTIATAEQSKHIDAETANTFGISGFTLMEIAGTSAAKEILKQVEAGDHGLFFCGKGNNGGDALVAARYLAQHDIEISLVFISGTEDLSPDAEKNYGLIESIASHNSDLPINFCTNWDDFDLSAAPDFIVDGMLGTGLDSDLRGDYVDAVQWANQQSGPLFVMDIPTGLHADSGQIMGDVIQASQTFAFGTLKQGFYLGSGPEQTGHIHFCELPFPHHLIRQCSTYLISESWLPPYQAEPAQHKYEAGVVYIIAGSEGLTGAAIMAAKSAWNQGVGAVMVVCPRGVLPVFENNLPQIIKKPVGRRDDVYFKNDHLSEVSGIISRKKGPVLLGPGLGRKDTTADFAIGLLKENACNFIIDADGLWALAQQSNWQKPDGASWILTPHPGELSRLFDINPENDIQRFEEVRKQALQKNITLLSKGFPIILGTPEGYLYMSGYDTRLFSRAGFGDILAGKTAAFAALGCTPAESCIRALLDGRNKAAAITKNNHILPEPLDLV
jgi:NAD(P)H-hydrate epimerase